MKISVFSNAAVCRTFLCVLAVLLILHSSSSADERGLDDPIMVEIDYMVLRDSAGNIMYTHQPQPVEMNAIIQMFACQGMTLIVEVDDELPHIEVLERDPQDSLKFFDYYGPNSYGALKNQYKDHWGGWHYCIYGHRYQRADYTPSGSSGLSELCGDDLLVSLGGWKDSVGTPFERAALLAHELGHNLGLTHTGNMDEAVTGPYTPNIPSVMSYFCTLYGVRSKYIARGLAPAIANLFKEIDYSHGSLCDIDENALDERFGVGMHAVDWDCDGAIEFGAVSQDLARDSTGHWCFSTGTRSVLVDFNEWASIQDYAKTASEKELERLPTAHCVTLEERQEIAAKDPLFRQPPIQVEPCVASRMIWAVPWIGGVGGGWCSDPFLGFVQAYNSAWAKDVLYLRYGEYNIAAPSMLLNKRMVITATSGAVIRPTGKSGD
jgi:hypothetical protein